MRQRQKFHVQINKSLILFFKTLQRVDRENEKAANGVSLIEYKVPGGFTMCNAIKCA